MIPGAEGGETNRKAGAPASNQANGVFECPKCGTKMPASRPSDRCPVCQLRGALGAGADSEAGDTSVLPDVLPSEFVPKTVTAGRFDHYEVLTSEMGEPV